jgi:hypothetical protein
VTTPHIITCLSRFSGAAGLVLSLSLCTVVPSFAHAAPAGGAPVYERLKPVPPDPTWSAALAVQACLDIQANAAAIKAELAKCPAKESNLTRLETASAFCNNPLDFSLARPMDLQLIAAAKCADAPKSEDQAKVERKGLLPGIVAPEVQDAIVRGLAAFLVGRAKAEALAAIAIRIQEGLCEEESGRQLLPLTCALIGTADPYAVPISWGAIKATAERDLHDLPLAILSLTVPRGDETKKQWKDFADFAYVGVDFAQQVFVDRVDATRLLVGLRSRYLSAATDCKTYPAGCSLLLTGIATEVVAPEFEVGNQRRELFLKVATRFIVERARGDKLIPPDVASVVASADSLRDVAAHTLQALSVAKASVPAAGTAHKDVTTMTAAMRIEGNAVAVTDLITVGLSVVGPRLGMSSDTIARVVRAVPAAGQLVVTARQGEYLTAVISAGQVLDIMWPDGTPVWVRRYLPFIGELAQAKDPAEVEKLLQGAAAPVGSYRGKRGSGKRSVTVNGYLGAAGGWEWLADGSLPHASSFRGGLFAPIGIEVSRGFGDASSIGVFLSVIDLGALVDFRTASETETHGTGMEAVQVEQQAVLGFDQVFAPGLHLVWGISDTPLVLGAGAALTPNLRRVTFVGDQTTDEVTALRVGAFLAIDITIFPM